eukprot:TRINITY_DN104306_c0_g1_i1.p1 TRINITY_DN104306_c0_g1~~TRINITY_DN104306_c0_g1_i1.p1  ORF type:complete len:131 (+),score=4.94 TRINITY_DN104306_c0_g1_i1:157-549(+)
MGWKLGRGAGRKDMSTITPIFPGQPVTEPVLTYTVEGSAFAGILHFQASDGLVHVSYQAAGGGDFSIDLGGSSAEAVADQSYPDIVDSLDAFISEIWSYAAGIGITVDTATSFSFMLPAFRCTVDRCRGR